MATLRLPLILNGNPIASPHVGQGTYTIRLIRALRPRLNDRLLVILSTGVAVPDEIAPEDILWVPSGISLGHELMQHIVANNRLLRFVRKKFPQALFHSPGPIAGGPMPGRTIVTIHDCIYRSFENYLGRFFIRRLYLRATELFARHVSLVLTDSNFSKAELITKLRISASRIEVLYPWVGNECLEEISTDEIARVRSRYNLPARFWLYLGGYDYRKNVEFLIAAYSRLTAQKNVPPLVLAGKIPSYTRVTCDVQGSLKKNRVRSDQIQMPGMVSTADLPALYRAASLMIYPSLMEGFGLPPAEAMAVGTPVLASNTSSLPEVVRNATSRFDPVILDSLVEKLSAAANDETQFRSNLPQEFTESYGVSRYLELIDRVQR